MKKLLLLSMLSTLSYLPGQAQQIAYSEQFEEIRGTWRDKLILLNNGKTALISISEGDGIEVTLYGADHKLLTKAKTDNEKWTERKLSASSFEGIYEINGEIVMFIGQLNRGNIRSLHRLILSTETGKLTSAEKLDEMPLNNDAANDFYVKADEASGSYAVMWFGGHYGIAQERIRVSLYDKTHKLVKKAALGDEVNTKKFTNYAGMAVHNNDVFVCTNDFEPKNKSLKMPFFVSVLRGDATAFTSQQIGISPVNNESQNIVFYNPNTDMLQMRTLTMTSSETKGRFGGYSSTTNYYTIFITFIDAATLQGISAKQVTYAKADEYAIRKLEDKEGFNGGTPEIYSNYDNSFALQAYEGKSINGTSYNHQMAITQLDKTGQEAEAYVINIPEVNGNMYTRGTGGNVYDHFYISTKNANYILINDLPENFDKAPTVEPHKLSTIGDANTVILKLADGNVTKSYLYGPPKSKRSGRFTKFANTSYNKEQNTLAVLMVDNDKGDKMSQIAWITF